MADHNEALRAWEDFCDNLKQAGRLLVRPTTPTREIDQVTGARALARNIALGLQFEFENNDPLYPELMHYFDPVRKQGGDNTDAIYVGAPVNGTDTYVIHGDRGTARYFAITVLEDGLTREITLPPSSILAGTLREPGGAAVVGAYVRVFSTLRDESDNALFLGEGQSAGDGTFEVFIPLQ